MTAYVFPASKAALARIKLNDFEESAPCKVFNGPHARKWYLDADLANRNSDWIPHFEPLIANPDNQVERVELSEDDIAPPPREIHPA